MKIKQECLSECEEDSASYNPLNDADIKIEPNLLLSIKEEPQAQEEAAPSDEDLIKCTICPYETVDKTYFLVHQKTHKFTYSCNYCGYKCGSASKLWYHEKKKHLKLEDLLYYCSDCSFTSLVRKHLRQHHHREHRKSRLYSTKNYQCPKCPHKAKRIDHLIYHQSKEHNASIFKCKECNRIFLQGSQDHNNHVLLHSLGGIKMIKRGVYKCTLCNLSSTSEDHVIDHICIR